MDRSEWYAAKAAEAWASYQKQQVRADAFLCPQSLAVAYRNAAERLSFLADYWKIDPA